MKKAMATATAMAITKAPMTNPTVPLPVGPKVEEPEVPAAWFPASIEGDTEAVT